MGLDALQRHHLADLLAQLGDALTGPVLQGDQSVLGDQLGGLGGQRLQRQRLQVRHAAGQRDDLGTVGHGEQGPDGRSSHAGGTLRVTLHVLVQAVARHGSSSPLAATGFGCSDVLACWSGPGRIQMIVPSEG